MERTKFNVTKDESKRSCDGIVFDSVLEMRYYRDVVKPAYTSGEITHYEMQKPYILQEGFSYQGVKILPIKYIADFYLEYADGRKIVIDTKGMPDPSAKIKRKMFYFRYPTIPYIWMSYTKATGWVTYESLVKIRKAKKKEHKDE